MNSRTANEILDIVNAHHFIVVATTNQNVRISEVFSTEADCQQCFTSMTGASDLKITASDDDMDFLESWEYQQMIVANCYD